MKTSQSRVFCLFGLLIWIFATAFSSGEAHKGTYLYVKANGNGECTSWEDACDLQDALAVSVSGDQIRVAAGTYFPTNTNDRSASFALKTGVEIYGGFPEESGVWDTRHPEINLTILSGEIGVAGADDNSLHVVTAQGIDSISILDGFTLTGGNANGSSYPDNSGGGIFLENSNISLNQIRFLNNTAIQGGGMYNDQSSPILNNTTFIHNTATTLGGGILNDMLSDLELNHVIFSDNTASDGGAIFNFGPSNPILNEVLISGNTALNNGGGMVNFVGGNPILTDVTFSNNAAGNNGGAMYNHISSDPTLTNVTISANSAGQSGGGIYNGRSSYPALTNVTIVNNTATIAGGGIYNLQFSNPMLTNVTIANNLAGDSCGGICNNNGSITNLVNSILWGNMPDQIGNISTGTAIAAFSDIQGGYAGIGNINADPLLGELADNGGFTQTMAIPKDSPAVDAGDPDTCPTTDQRNGVRPVDSNGDELSICDMGAYEFQEYQLSIERNGNGDVLISPQKTMYDFGEEVTLTAIADSGWHFLGWQGALESIENPLTITILGNTSLTATFGNHRWFFPIIQK